MCTHDIVILMGIGWVIPLCVGAVIAMLSGEFKQGGSYK